MKYMTFNSSCSYAGIANMLEQYGIDTSDRRIALEMRLPYLFAYRDGGYLSGPMLQSAEWFDIYLNPLGFQLIEKKILSNEVVAYLKEQKTAMLGIKMRNAGKHAVVYIGMDEKELVFLNNKRENEDSPCEIRFTEEALVQNIDTEVVVATLQKMNSRNSCVLDKLRTSVTVLQDNFLEIVSLCDRVVNAEVLQSKLNPLFRPLLLDGISMLHLIGETDLADEFAKIQEDFLRALRLDTKEGILLKNYISVDNLHVAVQKYVELIKNEVEKLEA